jgi:hypothetical protein
MPGADPTGGADQEPHRAPETEPSRQDSPVLQGTTRQGITRRRDRGVLAVLATVVLVVALMALRLSNVAIPWDRAPDALSKKAQDARTEAFLASAPVELEPVPPQERASAVVSMKLDDESQETLRAAAMPVSSSASDPASVRLAWLTVWDTDDEDGDVVRIDSAGYTRTISLTKRPITFAVPLPADGVINITGVRDGEGGGITVGASSGSSRVVLPIMSVGQVIGLHVRTR